ncbi:uncharacterized protein LOC126896112 isoform X2 [Daktulosphaira vitifoliae]|uniref:uncharacterized protein LOC126896112 isoform X2 n=1 Tax=Daktulosphaira vitifoliae TaxID=58002 RepID=UPI0021AA3713|nr:uncharacterized protein LOC126896112 isoform X2 [Daktulosphaira vitifoliae]
MNAKIVVVILLGFCLATKFFEAASITLQNKYKFLTNEDKLYCIKEMKNQPEYTSGFIIEKIIKNYTQRVNLNKLDERMYHDLLYNKNRQLSYQKNVKKPNRGCNRIGNFDR